VVSRTFLGEKIEYVVHCGGENLQVVSIDRGGDTHPTEGDRVRLRFYEDTIAVLEGRKR